MINFIKALLQFAILKDTFYESSVELHNIKKNLENSVHFSQFQDIFTQKHKYSSKRN